MFLCKETKPGIIVKKKLLQVFKQNFFTTTKGRMAFEEKKRVQNSRRKMRYTENIQTQLLYVLLF